MNKPIRLFSILILSTFSFTSLVHADNQQATSPHKTKSKEKALEQTLKTKVPKESLPLEKNTANNERIDSTNTSKNNNTTKTTNSTKTVTAVDSPIVANAKKTFADKILNKWQIPTNALDQSISAKVTLDEKGQIKNIETQSHDANVKASLEKAIRASAPFDMPKDPTANKEAQQFNLNVDLK